jgi:hypothetical protein
VIDDHYWPGCLVSVNVDMRFHLEGIIGNLGVKNRVQVACLGFRLKLTSQIDGGV